MIDFADTRIPDEAEIPPDSVPPLSDVEFPCRVCGKESGPYGGRGPKPKYCPEHKKGNKGAGPRSAKVTGAPASLAAQATAVLVQLNGLFALGASALGLFNTAGAIAQANPGFEEAAYQALLTDQELCKFLLKGGAKSSKVMLGMAYVGMGSIVVPTAVMEVKEKRAAAAAARDAEATSRGAEDYATGA